MRSLVLATALAVALVPLALSIPSASAFGWCTAAGPAGHQCREHLACVGWGWDSTGEHCQYGVPVDWCDWLCVIGPWLP